MADVIFNGADTRQPVGMAEVTMTFADCEEQLGTAYHEVSITRRVYRDGKGEYLLNKTPAACGTSRSFSWTRASGARPIPSWSRAGST